MKSIHPSYRQLLSYVPKIERYFDVEFLTLPYEKFNLVRLSKNVSADLPLLIIMAGCHGEEPAPPLAIFKNYKVISETAKKYRVNLVIYPLVNPYGFDINKRLNRRGLSCNSNWIHKQESNTAIEVKVIKKELLSLKPKIFISLHEDNEIGKEFYMFSFGNRKYEKPLIQIGGKYFPTLKNCVLNDDIYNNVNILKGVCYNLHDGSAEDFMFHRGVEFSCCTETPSSQSLLKRIKCNTDLILKIIELTKNKRICR